MEAAAQKKRTFKNRKVKEIKKPEFNRQNRLTTLLGSLVRITFKLLLFLHNFQPHSFRHTVLIILCIVSILKTKFDINHTNDNNEQKST